ncbi:lipid-binding SYLF domain-containing protein [Acetobacteraceae bacterium H6797]|nr:lipid-binding SYLF domain-containing protein [Acetobacteraceae bacterium H6797]
MRRAIIATCLMLGFAAPLMPSGAFAQAAEEQSLVDRSTLTVNEMMGTGDQSITRDAQSLLQRARAVLICPRVFRAGLILGGEGGSCVLAARDGAGSWSSPAFYGMGSGSIGFQIGVQDAQVMVMIMNDKGLKAVLDSQFTIGADASIAVATLGAGVQGATTAAVGADIVTYARTRGLFAGISLSGSIIGSRSNSNQAYYGQSLSARQIVVDMAAHNPGSDPLRGALMRFGTKQPQ